MKNAIALVAALSVAVAAAVIIGGKPQPQPAFRETQRDVDRATRLAERLAEPGQPTIRKAFAVLITTDAAKARSTSRIAAAMCDGLVGTEMKDCVSGYDRMFDFTRLCKSGLSFGWSANFPVTSAQSTAIDVVVRGTNGLHRRPSARGEGFSDEMQTRGIELCPPPDGGI